MRIAVVGCGYWGKNLVRNFHELGALAGVHDADPDTAMEFSGRYDVPAVEWRTILSDGDIGAVAIATPAGTHAVLASEALEAGKHVFVEKPLALTTEEAEDVAKTAKRAKQTLMIGHLLQYHSAFLKLKETIERGDLGKLQYIYSNRLNLGKVRREENILWSFAPHDISMILALVGAEPDWVSAVGATYLSAEIADVTTTHLSFPGGVRAHVFVSWLHPFKEQKLVVVGEKGMAVFNDGEPWSRKLLLYPHRIDWVDGAPQPSRAEAEAVPIEECEPLKMECRHFLECAANGVRPLTDGAEAIRVLRVLRAAEESMAALA